MCVYVFIESSAHISINTYVYSISKNMIFSFSWYKLKLQNSEYVHRVLEPGCDNQNDPILKEKRKSMAAGIIQSPVIQVNFAVTCQQWHPVFSTYVHRVRQCCFPLS
jgi:hypothetical protein